MKKLLVIGLSLVIGAMPVLGCTEEYITENKRIVTECEKNCILDSEKQRLWDLNTTWWALYWLDVAYNAGGERNNELFYRTISNIEKDSVFLDTAFVTYNRPTLPVKDILELAKTGFNKMNFDTFDTNMKVLEISLFELKDKILQIEKTTPQDTNKKTTP